MSFRLTCSLIGLIGKPVVRGGYRINVLQVQFGLLIPQRADFAKPSFIFTLF